MIRKNIIVKNLNITYYQSDDLQQENLLVFLHGWQSQALHLKNIFNNTNNYLAIDLPGFGQSEQPKEIWGVTEYANFLKLFLDKLKITNPILVGHSFGGSVIINYLALGGSAKKIVLIDSSGIRLQTSKKSFYRLAAKIIKPFLLLLPKKISHNLRKSFYQSIDSVDYLEAGSLRKNYKKIIGEDLQDNLKKITTPTALIWGANDTSTPLSQGRLMHQLIANSKLHIIDQAGHFPFIDQPEKFMAIFLAETNVN